MPQAFGTNILTIAAILNFNFKLFQNFAVFKGSVENEANDGASMDWKRPRQSAAVVHTVDGNQTEVAASHAVVIHTTAVR